MLQRVTQPFADFYCLLQRSVAASLTAIGISSQHRLRFERDFYAAPFHRSMAGSPRCAVAAQHHYNDISPGFVCVLVLTNKHDLDEIVKFCVTPPYLHTQAIISPLGRTNADSFLVLRFAQVSPSL